MRIRIVPLLAALLLAFGLTALLHSTAEAKLPDGIEMEVECGYNGVIHPGRVNPVIVTLKNNSAGTNLSGTLLLEYLGIEYATPLELPTPSEKRFFLYFPCQHYSPHLTLRIRSRQYTEEFRLDEPAAFRTLSPLDTSIVVLTRQSGSLNALNQIAVGRLLRNPYAEATAQLGGGKTYVAYYDLDEIEPSPKFFSRADVIVLADVDYQQATAELAETLKAAASGGTAIVFSMGLSGAGIAGSPLAELCPLRADRTVQISSLGRFGVQYGLTTRTAKATLAAGTPASGAEVVAQAGNLPVIVQQRVGSGTVTALAFDYTTVPFKANPAIASIFLEHVLPIEDTTALADWFAHPQEISILMQRLGEATAMPPWFVLLFLAAYVLLIGPLNFFILDRFKRRTLVWITIPVVIGAFATLGVYTGYLHRGSDSVSAQVQELHIYPGATYAPYQTTMLMFTAERTAYELAVRDESAFLYPDVPSIQNIQQGFAAANPISGLTGGSIDSTDAPVAQMTQGKWTSKNFVYTGYRLAPGTVASSLSAVPLERGIDDLTGSFSLDLPFDLENCVLLAPGLMQDLGTLAGQGEYALPLPETRAQVPAADEPNYLLSLRPGFLESVRQATGYPLQYRSEVLLVGFTEELPMLAEIDRRHKSHSLSMVVVHLPFTPVLDSPRSPSVRTLLAGGWGYSLRERGAADETMRTYELEPAGALLLDYTISGTISGPQLLLHLNVLDPKTNQPLANAASFIKLERELADGSWAEINIPRADRMVDVPLAGLDDAGRRLRIRITASQAVRLTPPEAEVY